MKPFSSTESAAQYYSFFSGSGHPDFGTEQSTAFFWLWEETDTGILSLNVIFSKEDNTTGGAGRAYFTLSGLPSGWSWAIQDDNGDIGGTTDTTPTWAWDDYNTDGGVISGLEGASWAIDWLVTGNASNFVGITNWYFLSAGDGKYDNAFSLSAGDTLTVSAHPTPEPSTMVLLGISIAAFGLFRITRPKVS